MGKKEVPSLTVESRVKEFISGHECRTSGELADALNAKVAELLENAVNRCKANGRSTVRAEDL